MIDGRTVSAIITTYRRYATLDEVVASWLAPPVAQLWVLDGGAGYKPRVMADPRLLVFLMPADLGTKMDYAFALLTEGDLVCLADDDIVVSPGFLPDLERCGAERGGIVGVIGRTFHGPVYWGQTKFFRASDLLEPARVGFVGCIYLAPRELFGVDVRGALELPRRMVLVTKHGQNTNLLKRGKAHPVFTAEEKLRLDAYRDDGKVWKLGWKTVDPVEIAAIVRRFGVGTGP